MSNASAYQSDSYRIHSRCSNPPGNNCTCCRDLCIMYAR